MTTYFCREYPNKGCEDCKSLQEAKELFNCDYSCNPGCSGPISLEELFKKVQAFRTRTKPETKAKNYTHWLEQRVAALQDENTYLKNQLATEQKDPYYEQVKEFMLKAEQPVETASLTDEATMVLRYKLLQEEVTELYAAICNFSTHYCSIDKHKHSDTDVPSIEKAIYTDIHELFDAIGDIQYVLTGLAVTYGIPIRKIFDIVHKSNMTKFREDGSAIKRDDGKLLKSERFVPPNFDALVKDFLSKDTKLKQELHIHDMQHM